MVKINGDGVHNTQPLPVYPSQMSDKNQWRDAYQDYVNN